MTLDGFTVAQLQAISTDACSRAIRLFDHATAIALHMSYDSLDRAALAAAERDCEIAIAAGNEAWQLGSAALAELQRRDAQTAGNHG